MATLVRGRTTVRLGGVSAVVRPRLVAVGAVLALGVFFLFCVNMAVGEYHIGVLEVIKALVSEGAYETQLVVYDWRMPRALVGLFVGLAFGMAGDRKSVV